MTEPVLKVRDLCVSIGRRRVVRGVSFSVEHGQSLGIVGESGSGKSLTVLAATGLADAPALHVSGSSRVGEFEIVGAKARALTRVHGGVIGFVFQDPTTSLNPLLTVERQITEPLQQHRGLTRRRARVRALELLEAVGIPLPESRLRAYPHQMSGGQRQRIMIAIAISCDPTLLVADEPTTALDVTTQSQIIELVRDLQRRMGTALVWVSHDLGVIGQVAQDVMVLREGRSIEYQPITDLVDRPQHAYTRKLLDARPLLGKHRPAPADPAAEVVLDVQGLDVRFPVATQTGRVWVHAVDDVSFQLRRGHTLGVVGESGSGKTTIANVLAGLVPAREGTAALEGVEILHHRRRSRELSRKLALIFQDPFSCLDPRARISASLAEPMIVHGLAPDATARRERIRRLLHMVELPPDTATRYPHELSGGQRQRVSIARALALQPSVMILDEATAALDVSTQARVLALLTDLQTNLGLTCIFIAHDLAVIEQVSHEVLVLRQGRVQEYRAAADLFDHARSEYTRTLLAAIPPERPAVAH